MQVFEILVSNFTQRNVPDIHFFFIYKMKEEIKGALESGQLYVITILMFLFE
jgi:hypothetical protein